MEACHKQKKRLFLDVYGELEIKERVELKNHLKICEACRLERQQISSMLSKIKETMQPPELPPGELEFMAGNIRRELDGKPKQVWWRRHSANSPLRFIPALAAACILIVIIGIIGYGSFPNFSGFRSITKHATEEQLIGKDFEIIENLDLLKEMEAIRKLVKVIDNPKNRQPSEGLDQDNRGMKQDDYEKNYA